MGDEISNTMRDKVEVYRNLHKKCWSVRNNATGHVLWHCDEVLLTDVDLVVRPGGRAKVLREKRKNVHAFVRGERVAVASFDGKSERITYNPYKYKSFVSVETGKPVYKKDIVSIDGRNILGQ